MSQSQVELDKIRVAKELREIRRLYGHLQQQAAATGHRDAANNDAIVMLAPVADLDQWEAKYEAANHAAYETGDKDWHTRNGGKDYAADQLEEHHPLLVLAYHEDRIRQQLGTPTSRRATVNDAATYLASSIVWMFDDDLYGNPNYAATRELIKDLTASRIRLENILKDGIRHERTETPCDEDGCHKLLVKIYGASANLDHYKCPNRDHDQNIDYARFVAISHQHKWSAKADNVWMSVSDAAASIERSKFVIHNWMKPAKSTDVPFHGRKVRSRRDGPMRKLEVYWPDVRDAQRQHERKLIERKLKETA